MNQADVFFSLIARYKDVDLKPSGFAIVPDGPESSLVTFSLQEDLIVPDAETGIRVKSYVTNRIISEIREESKFLTTEICWETHNLTYVLLIGFFPFSILFAVAGVLEAKS